MLKYRIALINVFWCEKDINTRYFSNIEEQELYFNALTGGKFSPLVNFNIGNNVDTSIIYKDVNGRSIEELLSCNYAVVEKYNEDNNEVVSRRFYYAYPQQDVGTQLRVILSLDDIQTNYIKYKKQISPCFIKRACLNRFINDNTLLKFDNTFNSKLFETEDLNNFPKIPIKRDKLKLKTTNDDLINNWLYENVNAWCYIFIDPNKQYKNSENNDLPKSVFSYYIKSYNGNEFPMPTGVMCFPILKTNNGITRNLIVESTTGETINKTYIDYLGFNNFRLKNTDTSYIYTIKISNKPPLNRLTNYNARIENGDLILKGINETNYQSLAYINCVKFGTDNTGLFTGINDISPTIETYSYETGIKNIFNANEIINALTNTEFNPKLNSTLFKELVVCLNNGESFSYDLQKIGENEITFLYNETIQPEVSKTYIRLKTPTGLYLNPTQTNYTGLVSSNDNSIAYVNSEYANFIANNKNFWLQSNVNVLGDIGTGLIAGMVGYGDPLVSGITGVTNGIKSLINRNLTIDNVKNSPSSLKNANGNACFNLQVEDFGIYVELRTCLTDELKIANSFLNNEGFSVNLIDYIYNYDNIRTRFNYIEAEVEVINAPLSNIEKERLKDKLRAVRFWNSDEINYDLENYERGLNNG